MQAGVAKAEYAQTEDTQTWGAKTGSLRPEEPRRGSLDIEGFPDRGLQTPDRGSSDRRGLQTQTGGPQTKGSQTGVARLGLTRPGVARPGVPMLGVQIASTN